MSIINLEVSKLFSFYIFYKRNFWSLIFVNEILQIINALFRCCENQNLSRHLKTHYLLLVLIQRFSLTRHL